jgi:hypothetical protein
MIDRILEALEEGVDVLKRDTDKEYLKRVNDAMQLLLKALNIMRDDK